MDLVSIDNRELEEIINVIDWKTLSKFVDQRPVLKRKYISGGFQLMKRNISRLIYIIKQFGSEEDIVSLFLLWYGYQTVYKDLLDPYFESEEYHNFVSDREIEPGKYLLENFKFEELSILLKPSHAKIFRCMSPIMFDDKQLSLLKEIESKGDDVAIPKPEAKTGISISKENYEDYNRIKEITKELKQLRNQYSLLEATSRKLEMNNASLQKRLTKYNLQIKEINDSKINEELKHRGELQKELDEKCELQNQLDEVKTKLSKSNNEIFKKDNEIENLKKKINRIELIGEDRITKILSKLDIEQLVSLLKEPDEVNECLRSVVKPPSSDDMLQAYDVSGGVDKFYIELTKKENMSIDKIMNFCIKEVIEGNYLQSWADWSDEFYSLKCILRAKMFLTQSLYEILREYYAEHVNENETVPQNI